MKVSNAIAVLQIALEQHGDLDLYEGGVFGEAPPLTNFSVGTNPETPQPSLLLWSWGARLKPTIAEPLGTTR